MSRAQQFTPVLQEPQDREGGLRSEKELDRRRTQSGEPEEAAIKMVLERVVMKRRRFERIACHERGRWVEEDRNKVWHRLGRSRIYTGEKGAHGPDWRCAV